MPATETTPAGLRSLRAFAYRVAGPRDLVINVLINALVATWVYHGVDEVPLVGWLSLLVYCGPMCFLLPAITTYFGYLNGVVARWKGIAGPSWPAGTPWVRAALVRSFMRGAVVCACCLVCFLTIDHLAPNLALSKWTAVAVVGLTAGILGYVLHARAVVLAGRLGAGHEPRGADA
jgi:hypothetical protein